MLEGLDWKGARRRWAVWSFQKLEARRRRCRVDRRGDISTRWRYDYFRRESSS